MYENFKRESINLNLFTIRRDTRSYFSLRPEADMSQLPHGTKN